MKNFLERFPDQLRLARSLGEKISPTSLPSGNISSVILCGLGGSAIGGDIVRQYISNECPVPFFVNRTYSLPGFADPSSIVIISSYSGNTEETLSAFEEACKRKLRIITLSSGGKLKTLSEERNIFHVDLPEGYPPRAALGFSVIQQLFILSRLEMISEKFTKEIEEVCLLGETFISGVMNGKNSPLEKLARSLSGRMVIIYSPENMEPCALRLRQQINENSKQICFHHVIPEMNHNELVGWRHPEKLLCNAVVILLRDSQEHPRINMRFEICKNIFSKFSSQIHEIYAEGNGLLSRMFSLIVAADWISYFLALENGADPMPVDVIDYLKSELSRKNES